MKRILSLIIISLMIASSIGISSVSAWNGYSDIEPGKFVYLSETGWLYQTILLTNDINKDIENADDKIPSYIKCFLNDHMAREGFDILKTHSHKGGTWYSYWDPSFNSRHQAKFYLDEDEFGSNTPYYTINDIDWDHGLFIAANTHDRDQWANVYYYDTKGTPQHVKFEYND